MYNNFANRPFLRANEDAGGCPPCMSPHYMAVSVPQGMATPGMTAPGMAAPGMMPGSMATPGMAAPGMMPGGMTTPGMAAPGMAGPAAAAGAPLPGIGTTGIPTGPAPSPIPLPQGTIATPSAAPAPQTVESPLYVPGFLKSIIGRRVRVEFLIGTNGTTDRTGVLIGVGASYILLREPEQDDIVMCDLYSIKFVTVIL